MDHKIRTQLALTPPTCSETVAVECYTALAMGEMYGNLSKILCESIFPSEPYLPGFKILH